MQGGSHSRWKFPRGRDAETLVIHAEMDGLDQENTKHRLPWIPDRRTNRHFSAPATSESSAFDESKDI